MNIIVTPATIEQIKNPHQDMIFETAAQQVVNLLLMRVVKIPKKYRKLVENQLHTKAQNKALKVAAKDLAWYFVQSEDTIVVTCRKLYAELFDVLGIYPDDAVDNLRVRAIADAIVTSYEHDYDVKINYPVDWGSLKDGDAEQWDATITIGPQS